jgi:hypothetical protein
MNRNLRILRRAALLAPLFLLAGPVRAGLLGYWNSDGPAGATAGERLKDLSGNNYRGQREKEHGWAAQSRAKDDSEVHECGVW